MYPIAAVLVSERCAGWLTEDGFAHISTFGGAELGCIAALKTLEICSRPETRSMVHYIADLVRAGPATRSSDDYPDWFIGIRQNGVVIGLEFDHPRGAKLVMRHLYENGVWAIFSTLDPRVLQYKPGILLTPELRRGAPRPGGGRDRQRPDRLHRPGVPHEPRPCALMSSTVTLDDLEPTDVPRARAMLERAEWASRAFADATTRPRCDRIVEAVVAAAVDHAQEYAERAVAETGFGVVEHKRLKNEACSRGIARRSTPEPTSSRPASTTSSRSSRCPARPGSCWR